VTSPRFWGGEFRRHGSSPELAASYGAQSVRGLINEDKRGAARVLYCDSSWPWNILVSRGHKFCGGEALNRVQELSHTLAPQTTSAVSWWRGTIEGLLGQSLWDKQLCGSRFAGCGVQESDAEAALRGKSEKVLGI